MLFFCNKFYFCFIKSKSKRPENQCHYLNNCLLNVIINRTFLIKNKRVCLKILITNRFWWNLFCSVRGELLKIKSLTLCHPKRRSFSPKKLTRGWIIFFRKNNFLDTIFVNHVMFNSMSYSLTNLDRNLKILKFNI